MERKWKERGEAARDMVRQFDTAYQVSQVGCTQGRYLSTDVKTTAGHPALAQLCRWGKHCWIEKLQHEEKKVESSMILVKSPKMIVLRVTTSALISRPLLAMLFQFIFTFWVSTALSTEAVWLTKC